MAVVHTDRKQFVSVDEGREGWYLPAGRVDAGETFATGARREAKEEAGCDIELTGLLRFENSADTMSSRFRAIYEAKANPKAPLKTVKDKESDGAAWVTIKDLAKRQLRSKEVLHLFEAVAKGTKSAPIDIITGSDGNTIDSHRVITRLHHTVKVLVVDDKGNLLLRREEIAESTTTTTTTEEKVQAQQEKEGGGEQSTEATAIATATADATATATEKKTVTTYSVPSARLRGNRARPLPMFAYSVLSTAAGRECPPIELKSLLAIWHHAPRELDLVGEIGMAFVATLATDKPSASLPMWALAAASSASSSSPSSFPSWEELGFCWVPPTQKVALSEHDASLCARVQAKQTAPLSVLGV